MKKETRYALALAAIGFSFALCVTFLLIVDGPSISSRTYQLTVALLPNLIASLFVFVVIYFFVERVIEQREESTKVLLAIASSDDRRRRYEQESSGALQEILGRLEADKKRLEDRIANELQQIQSSPRASLNRDTPAAPNTKHLRGLYEELAGLESMAKGVNDKLKLISVEELNTKLKALEAVNAQLQIIIDTHRAVAQGIEQSAKKII